MDFFAPRMSRFRQSPSQIMTQRARDLQAEGREIVKLTAGEPDFATVDHVKQAVVEAMARDETRYTPINGTLEMRKAAQAKFRRDNGLEFDLDQITVGAGTKQILFNALMATVGEGDEVIVPAPYWTSYPDMVKLAGGTPVVVAAGRNRQFKISPDQLAEAITPRTKWLLFSSPCNPTGATYSRDELRALGEVLLANGHVHVLSDDVYEHLIFDGRTFSTMAEAEPRLAARCVTCNGVSKAHSMTGWRVGFAGGAAPIISMMSKMQSQSTAGVCSISQAAAVAALNGPQGYVAERTRDLQRRRDLLVDLVRQCPGLATDVPEGAMYLYVDCSGVIGKTTPDGKVIETDTDFALYLLEHAGVAVVQGEAYGLSPYLRVSFVVRDEELKEGARRMREACAALSE